MEGMSRDMGTIQTEAEYRRLFDEAMMRHLGTGARPGRPLGAQMNGRSFEHLLAMLQAGGR